ncbi:hypothetical protein ThvES_00017120, partial [Thiovulum sp. ES]
MDKQQSLKSLAKTKNINLTDIQTEIKGSLN